MVCFRIERKPIPSHKYVSFQKLPVLWEEVHFAKDFVLVILPLVSFVSREALNVFLGIDGLFAAVCIDEVLTVSCHVESFLVACSIAKLTACELCNDLGSLSQLLLVSNGIQEIRENGFGRENIPAMMAAVVVISLPLIVLFLIFRNKIMAGVARGGTKG